MTVTAAVPGRYPSFSAVTGIPVPSGRVEKREIAGRIGYCGPDFEPEVYAHPCAVNSPFRAGVLNLPVYRSPILPRRGRIHRGNHQEKKRAGYRFHQPFRNQSDILLPRKHRTGAMGESFHHAGPLKWEMGITVKYTFPPQKEIHKKTRGTNTPGSSPIEERTIYFLPPFLVLASSTLAVTS